MLDDAALRAYARARRAKSDTSGGLVSIEETLRGCELFDVVSEGVTVARYALRVTHNAGGIEGKIVAAVGNMRGVDLTREMLPVIERQLNGVDAVKVETRRRALVGKLIAQGYRVEGYILRKHIEHAR